ncbi:Predicted nucleic acid-binding protein, contains PIN domain [Halogranum amylolyticum]|uniref:Predicted nucleic acid-binding protein, contains PIN domain n=1 Tax=Halogranum amylolyticum TaxID=660520 RepID=A0A1H8VGH5_9EURY|nr:nucleic acid-binding protein [Halogranum amylolyticum]SEP14499.1 Predicted nucleic acid-binding protein, contains PIN domain [Halogranum amylolyticum]
MILAVADAGPVIHLDEIDALALLSAIDELLIPQTVYQEVEAGTVPPALESVEYELVESDATNLDVDLDPGETAALAVASERAAVLLTDDLAARDAANDRDVEVHGSIGVLVLVYARGELEKAEAAELMRALQTETSLFITDAVVEQGIALLDET